MTDTAASTAGAGSAASDTAVGNTAVTWHWAAPRILQVDLESGPANALGTAIVEGLSRAMDAAAEARIVIITSNIPGFFAAGADIKLMSSVDLAGFEAYGDSLRAVLDRIAAAVPLSIAAVEGLALGGGLELAAACTMRVAGRDAQLGVPEVKLGLIPGAGGTQRLPRLVGRGRALDLILTGRQVDAQAAYDMGLVDRLVQPGTALAEALSLATALARASEPAQLAAVRAVDAAFDTPLAEGNRVERSEIAALFEHGEGREGIAAFAEKRRPRFD